MISTASASKETKPKSKAQYKKIDLNEKGDLLVEGRRKCECMAQIHKLLNNCLTCGRIICEQEREGPCFFCGNQIYSKDNPMYKELTQNQFMTLGDADSSVTSKKKAIEHKNKLLSYEKNINPQSNIIDDEADWYDISNDVWMSTGARDYASNRFKEQIEKKEEDKKGISIAFDATQKKFVDNKVDYDDSKDKKDAQEFMAKTNKPKNLDNQMDTRLTEDQMKILEEVKAKMEERYKQIKQQIQPENPKLPKSTVPNEQKSKRVQHDIHLFEEFKEALANHEKQETEADKNEGKDSDPSTWYDEEIYDISFDGGNCLSMHQPWASLVVLGFKRFEGRQWNSEYRGPLWIQAGSKIPTQEEIDAVEAQYKRLYKGVKNLPPFPDRYPTGSLLGLVDLEDIVPLEVYEQAIEKDKREETSSKFLFVVRNPRKLLYPIKLVGQKQIFTIDDELLLETAKSSLVKVKTNWYPYYANQVRDLRAKLKAEEELKEQEGEDITATKEDFENLKLSVVQVEECGVVVGDFFTADEQVKTIEFFFKATKGKRNLGKGFLQSMKLDKSNEMLRKIYNYVPYVFEQRFKIEKKLLAKKMRSIDFFFFVDKEKEFVIDDKYLAYLYFGRGMKLDIEDKDSLKRKSAMVKCSNLFVKSNRQGYQISFGGIDKSTTDKDSENLKLCNKQLTGNSLLVLIY